MTEDRYREKMAAGRIRAADLAAVLGEDLGEHGQTPICSLASRFDLRLAMLEHPLRTGPPKELRWFVAETDSLRRMRHEVSAPAQAHFISEARHWINARIVHSICAGAQQPPITRDPQDRQVIADVLSRFDVAKIENWTDATWEAAADAVVVASLSRGSSRRSIPLGRGRLLRCGIAIICSKRLVRTATCWFTTC